VALEVQVIRSPKRRKTAQARLVDGRLEVRIPARSSKAEEQRLVELFERRYRRSISAERIDVAKRAEVLAARYRLPRPNEVRWVSNQSSRWGSCTPSTGVIRLSDRMAGFPTWVIDAVLVHELAHLTVSDHGPDFRELVARYPLLERAEGYLIARSGSDSPTEDPLATDLHGLDPPG
jgi:predicted metal-dependent hydrolase